MLRMYERHCAALSLIGRELGFDVGGYKTELGTLDCVWRVKRVKYKDLPLLAQNLPLIVFEVICSEDQKGMRGSISNMLVAKPSLAVFVLVEKEIRKQRGATSPDMWLKRIQNYAKKIKESYKGIMRIDIWTDEDVDRLFRKICKKSILEDLKLTGKND